MAKRLWNFLLVFSRGSAVAWRYISVPVIEACPRYVANSGNFAFMFPPCGYQRASRFIAKL